MIAAVGSARVRAMRMRLFVCGVAALLSTAAGAADMPDFLRGSSTVITAPGGPRWDGIYVGGHVGWSVPGIDFTNNNSSASTLLGNAGVTGVSSSPLGTQDTTATHFGAFAGYQ